VTIRVWTVVTATAAVVAAGGLMAPAGTAAVASSPGTWSQGLGGAAHQNENLTQTQLTAATIHSLRKGWSRVTGSTYRGQPVIVNNVLFTVDVVNDDHSTSLTAINATTGAVLWSTPEPAGYTDSDVSPAVADGIVVVALDGPGEPQLDAAYTASNGHHLWSSTEPAVTLGLDNSAADWLTVADSRVFTRVDDGYLSSRAITTGHLQWRDQLATFGSSVGDGEDPVFGDGRLFIQGAPTAEALNPATGATEFTYQGTGGVGSGGAGLMAIANHRLVVGAGGDAYAFSTTGCAAIFDCAPLWSHTFPAGTEDVTMSALDANDAFFTARQVGANSPTFIYALSSATGRQLWRDTLPPGTQFNGVMRTSNLLLGTTNGNDVILAFPVTCSHACAPIWTAAAMPPSDDNAVASDPAVVGGRVYVNTEFSGTHSFQIGAH
jgi:outer membrane protein assembly factor BamB